MTLAWYGHLGPRYKAMPLWIVVIGSWGIAFVEYCFQVPANRIGHNSGFSGAQLNTIQEIITLCVFVPFAVFYLNQPLKLDFLWAGLCMVGAVYFIFRGV